jgi:hypothetical protein
MENINVIEQKEILRKEILIYMLDQNIISINDYLKWQDLTISEKALNVTKAMEKLEVF